MKKIFVIHPYLFVIFPILFFYAHNIDELLLNVIFLPIVISVCLTFLAYILLGGVFKDKKKIGLFISLSLLLFFSYGILFEPIKNLTVGGVDIGRHRYLLLIWGILYTCGTYFIVKTRRHLHNLTTILNIVAAFLVINSVINIGVYEFKGRAALQDNRNMNIKGVRYADPINAGEAGTLPDIYYIIFDRYASSDILKEYYNYDNSGFADFLTKKGFYVASESRCNYPITYLSLASSLNMKYLNYLVDEVGEDSRDRTIVYKMLEDYEVWRFLKPKGYKFIHFGSWWGPTQRNKYADRNFYAGRLNYFSRTLLYQTTVVRAFFEKIFGNSHYGKITLYEFEKLAEMPGVEGPKFVFAHINIPHPPYLFDRNGEVLTREKIKERTNKENYLNQLIFANKKIKILIDEILSKSKVPPIIILQSDEGPELDSLFEQGLELPSLYVEEFEKIEKRIDRMNKKALRIRTRILNAYYLPNVDKNVLYASITPVNSFRLIFNLYFDTHLELLPDETYTAMEWGSYVFIDVTDKVKYD